MHWRQVPLHYRRYVFTRYARVPDIVRIDKHDRPVLVPTLRSTDAGGMPRSSTSSLKAARSLPPPFAPQRPSPGVAQTKIWQSFLISRFYAATSRSPDQPRFVGGSRTAPSG